MKKILLVIIISFSNISFSQTRQETIDWLNYKFAIYTDPWFGVYSINVEKINDAEYVVITKKGLFNDNNHITEIYISQTPGLIENVITTSEYRTDGKLGIKINTKCYIEKVNDSEPKLVYDVIRIYCTPAPDETIIRMRKGIVLLINSIGHNLKEPKELFKD